MNEKTKSSAQTIFRIVAILLCLALISTSIVSSTLARFVITKDATMEATLEAFGVKMQVKNGSSVVSNLDANSLTVTYETPIEIYPGYTDSKSALLFIFDGELTVPARVKVAIDFELDLDVFYISSTDCPTLPTSGVYRSNTYHMPTYFRVGNVAPSNPVELNQLNAAGTWQTSDDIVTLKNSMRNAMYSTLNGYTGMYKKNTFSQKEFSKGSGITFNSDTCGFGFDFYWPARTNGNTDDDRYKDIIETCIAEKAAKKQAEATKNGVSYTPMKLIVTVTLEQTGT